MSNKLTIIIAFRNEGEEIEHTVSSIRATATTSPYIILVDDCSDDSYDYQSIAKRYKCCYAKKRKSAGPALARESGVGICKTDFFVLMDGHMRLYDPGWDAKILNRLAIAPHSIICSSTTNIADSQSGKDFSGGSFGAYLNFMPGEEYTLKWSTRALSLPDNPEELQPIISVLGAFYATSKAHWRHINGLEGLNGYGFEETWLSVKTWLSGGRCYSLKNFVTGHLYRNNPPTKINLGKYYANQILMNHFFTINPKDIAIFDQNLAQKIDNQTFSQAMQEFINKKAWLSEFKPYFYQKIAKVPFAEILELNNSILPPAK